uniref:Uncharacterized protein n=1 Tax=Clastoptera arizonana TaxID=38151 RepID=A0A1B6EG46_9HEMI
MSFQKMETFVSSAKKPRQSVSSAPPPLPPMPDKLTDNAPSFVAKSPPSDKYQTLSHPLTSTLKTRSSDSIPKQENGEGRTLLICGGIQMLCGLLMGVFGVLTLLHDASMAEYAGGVWSGAVAMICGLVGIMVGIRGCCSPEGSGTPSLGVTLYLALCLVTIAVCNLGLVLASTGLVRDAQRPNYYIPDENDPAGLPQPDMPLTNWAPVLANLGLLMTTTLLCITTVVAAFKVYRKVCPCTAPHDRLLGSDSPASSSYSSGSKQKLVKHWLGQQAAMYPSPGLLVYPPQLVMEGNQIYTVPSSIGYPQCITPIHGNPYPQRRRSTPHRTPRDVPAFQDSRRNRRRQRDIPKEKKREVTEEELEKTYTGLDREIAEEFISISMQQSSDSGDDKPRFGKENRVIGCITPM